MTSHLLKNKTPFLHTLTSQSIYLALFILGSVSNCHAQQSGNDSDKNAPPPYQWAAGVGVISEESPYRGDSSKTSVLPLPYFDNEYLHLFESILDYKLGAVGAFSYTLRAEYAIDDGYKAQDSPYLAGMKNRDSSLWLGGTVNWKNPMASIHLEYLGATGQSDGSRTELRIDHIFHTQRLRITPRVSTTFDSKKYVDYYYGVRPTEATENRTVYVGNSTTEASVGVRFEYLVNAHNILALDISEDYRGTGITDSPLVDKASGSSAKIGYMYRF